MSYRLGRIKLSATPQQRAAEGLFIFFRGPVQGSDLCEAEAFKSALLRSIASERVELGLRVSYQDRQAGPQAEHQKSQALGAKTRDPSLSSGFLWGPTLRFRGF